MWDSGINSSEDPCEDNFRGPFANSEEATHLIQFFLSLTRDVHQAYITIQAGVPETFNGHVAYPFSHSAWVKWYTQVFLIFIIKNFSEAIPENWERSRAIAIDMSGSINRMTGARYRTGSASNIAGPTAGTSSDYAAAVAEVPLVYTLFTTPSGRFGWDVETWRIHPIVDQIFAAIDDLARHLIFSPTTKV